MLLEGHEDYPQLVSNTLFSLENGHSLINWIAIEGMRHLVAKFLGGYEGYVASEQGRPESKL